MIHDSRAQYINETYLDGVSPPSVTWAVRSYALQLVYNVFTFCIYACARPDFRRGLNVRNLCVFIHLLQTCEYYILKVSEPIFMPVGWHKWSTGKGCHSQLWHGGHGVKDQGHMTPKIDFETWGASREKLDKNIWASISRLAQNSLCMLF